MLDNPVGYNTKGSALAFVFVDGDVYLNPGKEGGLSLSKRLQNKLRTIAEKVYFNYLKVFFIDTLEAKKWRITKYTNWPRQMKLFQYWKKCRQN